MNYETVKTFGKERSEVGAFSKLENTYRGLFIWYRISLNVLNLGQEVLLHGGLGTVLVLAVHRAFSNKFSAGDVVLVLMYTNQVFGPLLVSADNPAPHCETSCRKNHVARFSEPHAQQLSNSNPSYTHCATPTIPVPRCFIQSFKRGCDGPGKMHLVA